MHGMIDLVITQLQSTEFSDAEIEKGISKFSNILKILDEHRKVDINEYIPDLSGVYK